MKRKHYLGLAAAAVVAYLLWKKCKKTPCNCPNKATASASQLVVLPSPAQSTPAPSIAPGEPAPAPPAPVIVVENIPNTEGIPTKFRAIINNEGYFYYNEVPHPPYRTKATQGAPNEPITVADYVYAWNNYSVS